MKPDLKARLLDVGPAGGLFCEAGPEAVAAIEAAERDQKSAADSVNRLSAVLAELLDHLYDMGLRSDTPVIQQWRQNHDAAIADAIGDYRAPRRIVHHSSVGFAAVDLGCRNEQPALFIHALCNDGTLLELDALNDQTWRELPPVPQPENTAKTQCDMRLFLNNLKKLNFIDLHQLPELPEQDRHKFLDDPVRYFIKASDQMQAAIFRELNAR